MTNSEAMSWLAFSIRASSGSTLLLLLGLVAIWMLRNHSAATKHLIATFTIVALLLLPGLLTVLPGWELGWLPLADVRQSSSALSGALPGDPSREESRRLAAAGNHDAWVQDAAGSETASPAQPEPSPIRGSDAEEWQRPPTEHRADARPVAAAATAWNATTFFSWARLVTAAMWTYIAVVAIGFVRMLIDYRVTSKMISQATRVTDGLWGNSLVDCRSAFALSRSVECRLSERVKVPMVGGIVRPVVLLPRNAIDWPTDRLTAAIAHEMAHIARHDLLIQLFARIVGVVYWFQPLSYLLLSIMQTERESACDDLVIGRVNRPTDYARHLLAVAAGLGQSDHTSQAALAMARSSSVEQRIQLILSASRCRTPPAARVVGWMLALSMIGLLMSAGLNPLSEVVLAEAAAQDEGVRQTQSTADSNAKPNDQPVGAEKATIVKEEKGGSDANNAQQKVVRGRVVNEAGEPVGGAQLWLPLQFKPRRIVQAMADDAGRYELKFPRDWISSRITSSSWTIWAYAPGYGIATRNAYPVIHGAGETEIELQLPPQSKTSFKVLSPAGQPLPDILLQPQNYKTSAGYELVPEEMQPVVSARTDKNGVAKLSAMQPGLLYRILLASEKFGKQSIRLDREAEVAIREIQLRETGRVQGRLIGERPEWLRGVRVAFETDNRDERTDTSGFAEAVTDERGHFEVPRLASGGPVRTYVSIEPSLPVRPRLTDNLYLTAGETLQLEIPLVSAPIVHGKVRAKSGGTPIANAEISLGYGGFRQSEHVVTNEAGLFEGRVLPGPVRVQIISLPNNYVQLGSPWDEPFEVPSDVDEFVLPTIEVVGTHKLAGRLIDAKDQALAGVQVMAVEKNRRYGFAKTDAEGRFTMDVPDGVTTSIEVYSDKRGQEPVTVVENDPLVVRYDADVREKEVDAERASKADVTLTGRVLSDDKPVKNVTLILRRGVSVRVPGAAGKALAQQVVGMRYLDVARTETDADGNYRLPGLKASDSYSIEVKPSFPAADPAWHHQSPWLPKLPDDARGEVALPDLKLRKLTQSLSGIVVDPEGKPVAGATVSAQLRDGFQTIPRISMSGPPPWTTSDQQGRFELKQLPDEPLAIMAYLKPGADGRIRFPAKLNVGRNQHDIRIVLDPSLLEETEK